VPKVPSELIGYFADHNRDLKNVEVYNGIEAGTNMTETDYLVFLEVHVDSVSVNSLQSSKSCFVT